jgi:hypothetical protein
MTMKTNPLKRVTTIPTFDDWSKVHTTQYDWHAHMNRNQKDGVWTHRYSKGGNDYTIDTYKETISTRGKGIVGEEPEWLRVILDIAQLGGHGIRMPRNAIPDYVLWFETDEKLRLLKIVDENDDMSDMSDVNIPAYLTFVIDIQTLRKELKPWKEQACVNK